MKCTAEGRERKAQEEERAAIEKRRAELYGLFDPMNVTLNHDGKTWELTFNELSERDVREIAKAVKAVRQ